MNKPKPSANMKQLKHYLNSLNLLTTSTIIKTMGLSFHMFWIHHLLLLENNSCWSLCGRWFTFHWTLLQMETGCPTWLSGGDGSSAGECRISTMTMTGTAENCGLLLGPADPCWVIKEEILLLDIIQCGGRGQRVISMLRGLLCVSLRELGTRD